jgi:hypothetical protein
MPDHVRYDVAIVGASIYPVAQPRSYLVAKGQRGARRTRPRSCRTQKSLHALHAAERHPDNRAAWSCDGDRNGGGTARRGGAIYPVRLGRSSPGTTNWTASLRLKYSTSDADP